MKTVDIALLGRSYQVACAPGEEQRLAELGKMLEEKMRLAASAGQGSVGEIRLLLLAGLMLADDVLEAKEGSAKMNLTFQQSMEAEEDLLIAAVEHLSGRINSLAARIENT